MEISGRRIILDQAVGDAAVIVAVYVPYDIYFEVHGTRYSRTYVHKRSRHAIYTHRLAGKKDSNTIQITARLRYVV